MEYLPIGDKDDFDWKKGVLSEVELQKLVNIKQQLNEKIGLVLYYGQTDVGILLLADDTKSILICMSINRKTIQNTSCLLYTSQKRMVDGSLQSVRPAAGHWSLLLVRTES